MFYAGGANSVRAFTVRSIGPGGFKGIPGSRQFNYMMQNGEIKLVANLEYRTRIVDNLHGAIFLDAGNVWNWNDFRIDPSQGSSLSTQEGIDKLNQWFSDTKFRMSRLFDQTALGTGVGLRYDLDFLVIRVDWGFALHAPYDTGHSGYFNLRRFKDMHSLHLAIGYPF
jgi:outer membrane protein assembly factor BamA